MPLRLHRYLLTVSYRGTHFGGWQSQPNARTVQDVLEGALRTALDEHNRVEAAGRTDAGVHAFGQSVHIDLTRDWPQAALVHGVNRHLPDDVRILVACPAPPSFHARFSPHVKEYRYRLRDTPVLSPLESLFVARAPSGLDVAHLQEALRVSEGEHDFSAFTLTGGSQASTRRRIFEARLSSDAASGEFTLIVRAGGFLRGMVRGLVGTWLEVGLGKRSLTSMRELLRGAARSEAGPTAPAHGLCLHRVDYEDPVLTSEPDPLE